MSLFQRSSANNRYKKRAPSLFMASHYCLSCGAPVAKGRFLCDTCESSLLEKLCNAQRYNMKG